MPMHFVDYSLLCRGGFGGVTVIRRKSLKSLVLYADRLRGVKPGGDPKVEVPRKISHPSIVGHTCSSIVATCTIIYIYIYYIYVYIGVNIGVYVGVEAK